VIKGRGGRDTLIADELDACCEGVRVDLATGRARYSDESTYATISSIENVVGTTEHDVLLGDDRANILRGGDGDDSISGRGGNDRLFGGADVDTIRGGPGDDLLSGGSGRDRNDGGSGNDRCTSPSSGPLTDSCEPQ